MLRIERVFSRRRSGHYGTLAGRRRGDYFVTHSETRLRRGAMAIWQAGVAAADSERLVRDRVGVIGSRLRVAGREFDLVAGGRIVVVGAGKAGSGMAAGIEHALAGTWAAERVCGWVNVPADC